MVQEGKQRSAMLIKTCSIHRRSCSDECAHVSPGYAFSSACWTGVACIQSSANPIRLFFSCAHFPFEWTLFSFWLEQRTWSAVLPGLTDPLSNSESVPDHSMYDCVVKCTFSKSERERGTPQKIDFLPTLIPLMFHSSTLKCSVTMAPWNATMRRKCVISHVVSVDQSISRYRDSLAGDPLPLCLCEAKLNTIRRGKNSEPVASAYKAAFSHAWTSWCHDWAVAKFKVSRTL